MKATGIVRRIDDLGRVVIPKEIRRTMHIREGDPLEIYTDRDGEVIFKKYSPIGELGSFAAQYAETVHKTCGFPVIITDRDAVIAVSGVSKKDFHDRRITSEVENIMESRQPYTYKSGDSRRIAIVDGIDTHFASVVCPIIAEGDAIGTVMVVMGEENTAPGELEIKMTQSAAAFLGKQLES